MPPSSRYDNLPELGRAVISDVSTVLALAIPFGAQLVLQWICCIGLWRPKDNFTSTSQARVLLLAATIVTMVSSTVALAVSAALAVLDGMIVSGYRASYSRSSASSLHHIVEIATEYLNILVGDGVVFWRAWVLWKDKRKMVYIPGILLCCTAVGAISAVVVSILNRTSIYMQYLTFGLSVGTNISTNASIGYFTWQHRKAVRRYLDTGNHRARCEKALIFVLESGIVYTAILIFGGITTYVFSSVSDTSLTWNLLGTIMNAIGMGFVGIYPTLFIVVVFWRKSIWDASGNVLDMQRA